jgi:hypothetical protein
LRGLRRGAGSVMQLHNYVYGELTRAISIGAAESPGIKSSWLEYVK